jgi:hypothetical protein
LETRLKENDHMPKSIRGGDEEEREVSISDIISRGTKI